MQRARTFFSEFCVFGRAALRQADHSEAYWLPCTATFCRARQISYMGREAQSPGDTKDWLCIAMRGRKRHQNYGLRRSAVTLMTALAIDCQGLWSTITLSEKFDAQAEPLRLRALS